MKFLAFVLSAFVFCTVPAFSQMGILTTDAKLHALKKEGKFDEAIASINERIKTQPNNGELYLRRAEFLKLQNKLDEAITDISRGIEIDPDNATFYIARAEYYNLKNNSEAMLKDVETAASLAPNKTGVLIGGAEELTRGKQYEEIIKLADFYVARNASNDDSGKKIKYWAYRIRGESKFALKDYVGALEDSITAINHIAYNGESNHDGSARIALNTISKSDAVLQVMQNYLKDDKRIFDFYNRLFDALEEKTEISVKQDFDIYIKIMNELEPNKTIDTAFIGLPEARNLEKLMINCAELYVEKGQPEKGIKLFERIVQLKLPNKWWRYGKRADFYIKLKKNQAAIDDLTFVVSGEEGLSPRYPTYILYLTTRGRLYESINQFDKAIADYEMVRTISSGSEKLMNEMITKARQKQIEAANPSR